MTLAAGTDDFDARHAVSAVDVLAHILRCDRLKEARPAGPRIEFRIRREQRQTAADAGVNSGLLVVEQVPAERRFGSLIPQDAKLCRGEALLPLSLRQHEFRRLDGANQLALTIKHMHFDHDESS